MTFGSTAMPGILFAADARSLRRSQPDPPLESMPSAKFVSTEVTGCVSEPGRTCSVRSSEEAEAPAGAICALIGVRGIAELSSQKKILKRQIRKVNLTSCPNEGLSDFLELREESHAHFLAAEGRFDSERRSGLPAQKNEPSTKPTFTMLTRFFAGPCLYIRKP
jgi:hypothetical protein